MALLQRDQAPPPHYYAGRILDMLAGVERQYSDLLEPSERTWIEAFRRSTPCSQRLLARLVGRKGPLFRVDSLDYPEVGQGWRALDELASRGLVQIDPCGPADAQLVLLTCAELNAFFPRVPRMPKARLVDHVAARYPDGAIRARIAVRHRLVALVGRDVIERLQVLFFGGAADLSTFVLQDLGILRYESYDLDPARRLFADRHAFDRFLALARLRDDIGALEQSWDGPRARAIADTLARPEAARLLERRRGQILNRLGAAAERADDTALALAVYASSDRPPARERRVRVLARLGEHDAARALIEKMRAEPLSSTETQFAAAFSGRRMRPLPSPRETRLRLPRAPRHDVESAALAAVLANGGDGRHLENQLPLTLFGLAFWDVVFAPIEGAFSHAFQDRPLDLYWSDFRAARRDAIDRRLCELSDPTALCRRVLATHDAKRGVVNALVAWGAIDRDFLARLVATVPAAIWCAIFDHLLDDLEHRRQGFPDLTIVYGTGSWEWLEVKGPGDQLRREQRIWFDFFARHGMPARVVRVEW